MNMFPTCEVEVRRASAAASWAASTWAGAVPVRSLIPTEPVLFERPRTVYGDRGEKSTAWERVGEAACAVEPLAPSQPDEGAHPYGAVRAVRIHVPSTLGGSLRGCRATVRGERYEVQGDPIALTASPLPFDRAVEAVRCDG